MTKNFVLVNHSRPTKLWTYTHVEASLPSPSAEFDWLPAFSLIMDNSVDSVDVELRLNWSNIQGNMWNDVHGFTVESLVWLQTELHPTHIYYRRGWHVI